LSTNRYVIDARFLEEATTDHDPTLGGGVSFRLQKLEVNAYAKGIYMDGYPGLNTGLGMGSLRFKSFATDEKNG